MMLPQGRGTPKMTGEHQKLGERLDQVLRAEGGGQGAAGTGRDSASRAVRQSVFTV